MNEKQEYVEFCKKNRVPFFNEPWWLDIVSEGEWSCVVETKGHEVQGFLPYVYICQFGMSGIGLPLLTQYIDPILMYPANQKYSKKLSFEKDVLQGLYQKLPKTHFVNQTWGHRLKNWLPLYWLGYRQTSRYSYVIDDIKNIDMVYKNFETKIRGDIRKAEKVVRVVETKDSSVIFDLVSKTFDRKSIQMPYTSEFLSKVVEGCIGRNGGQLTYAIDSNQKIHAAIFIVWDHECAYYLLGGGDAEHRNSGATSLLLWNAIKSVAVHVDSFDFEGSMMEPIERFVRGFGAKQVELKVVSKSVSKRYIFTQALKDIVKQW